MEKGELEPKVKYFVLSFINANMVSGVLLETKVFPGKFHAKAAVLA